MEADTINPMFELVVVESYAGEGSKNGVEKGPGVIAEALKKQSTWSYFVPEFQTITSPDPDESHFTGEWEKLQLLPEVAEVLLASTKAVTSIVGRGNIPITLMGSDEVGSAVFSQVWNPDTALVWIDSHPDLNTPRTTPSGHIHGMSLAMALGIGDQRLTKIVGTSGARPVDVVLLGAGRDDIDPGELNFLEEHPVFWVEPEEIRKSTSAVLEKTIAHIKKLGKTKVALHFDLDVVSPEECPGVSVPGEDTISVEEALGLTVGLVREFELVSLDVAEYNPRYDTQTKTLKCAIEVIESVVQPQIKKE